MHQHYSAVHKLAAVPSLAAPAGLSNACVMLGGLGSALGAAAPASGPALSRIAATSVCGSLPVYIVQDLLNLDAGPPSAAPAGPSGGFDALGGLGDAFGSAAPAPAPSFPAITAFSKEGVSVSFAFSKPPGQPHVTDITATYTNSDAAPVSGFSLQVLPTDVLPSACNVAVLGMLQTIRLCGTSRPSEHVSCEDLPCKTPCKAIQQPQRGGMVMLLWHKAW